MGLVTILFLIAGAAYLVLGITQCIKPYGLSRYTDKSVSKFRIISILCFFVSAIGCCLVAFGLDNFVLSIIGCFLLIICFGVLIFSSTRLEYKTEDNVEFGDDEEKNQHKNVVESEDDELDEAVDFRENDYLDDEDETIKEYSEGYDDDTKFDDEYEDGDDESKENSLENQSYAEVDEKYAYADEEDVEDEETYEDEFEDEDDEESEPAPRKRKTRTKTKSKSKSKYDDEDYDDYE
ncbi:MAG: Got1/Sft2-like family vesicle transport protein [Clostridia bacterium]|nr:Got1/Sft2-like family vesicle transport protein [Clostridia bacterium]